jgi:hypothetical protein
MVGLRNIKAKAREDNIAVLKKTCKLTKEVVGIEPKKISGNLSVKATRNNNGNIFSLEKSFFTSFNRGYS